MLGIITEKNRGYFYNIINQEISKDEKKYKFFGRPKKINIPGLLQFECVSLSNNKLNGYFSVLMDLRNYRLVNFSIVAFNFQREMYKDLYAFTKVQYQANNNFEFRICTQSPAFRLAERYFNYYNFEKIGVMKKSIKIDGEYYDEAIYALNKR